MSAFIFDAYHEDGLDVFFTCDQFPVQAEGYIDSYPFYYRARWGEWKFCVPTTRDGDPVRVAVEMEDGFKHEGDYDDTEYLSLEDARLHIAGAASAWRAERQQPEAGS